MISLLNFLKHINSNINMSSDKLIINFFFIFLVFVVFFLKLITKLLLGCFSLMISDQLIINIFQLLKCFNSIQFVVVLFALCLNVNRILSHFKHFKFVFEFHQILNASVIIVVFFNQILSNGQNIKLVKVFEPTKYFDFIRV